MWYAIRTLLRETSRFGPAVVAVSACAMLLMVQISLFLSAMTYISKPITYSDADLWIGHADAVAFDEGRPIPRRWVGRVAGDPDVTAVEYYLLGTAMLRKSAGGSEICTLVGVPMHEDSLGAGRMIPPELRGPLSAPGAVAANSSELYRFNFTAPGYAGEIAGRRVYYAGCVHDFKRFTGPYIFCSTETARRLLPNVGAQNTIYLLAKCRTPELAETVAQRLRDLYPGMSVYTRQDFVRRTQIHWFTRTKAGLMLLVVTVISSLVSLFVTSQTLYAATAAARREYAVLDAMGIPRRRIAVAVLWQSVFVGLVAAVLASPASYAVSSLLDYVGVPSRFEPWLLVVGGAMTAVTAPIAGLISLRSLQLIEPAELLH